MLLSEKQHIVYKDDAEKGYERRKPPEAARELKDMHLQDFHIYQRTAFIKSKEEKIFSQN